MPNKIFLFLILLSFPVNAHTFTGMRGFYDGLSHPVLGIDHFLAMVSVGIVSAQIGGRAIWTVPSTFVVMMIIGGIIEIKKHIFSTPLTLPKSLWLSQIETTKIDIVTPEILLRKEIDMASMCYY